MCHARVGLEPHVQNIFFRREDRGRLGSAIPREYHPMFITTLLIYLYMCVLKSFPERLNLHIYQPISQTPTNEVKNLPNRQNTNHHFPTQSLLPAGVSARVRGIKHRYDRLWVGHRLIAFQSLSRWSFKPDKHFITNRRHTCAIDE